MEESKTSIPAEIAGTEGNSEIFRLAAELGKALKDDPRMIRFEQAKAAYEEDTTLQTLLNEYDVQQAAMQQMAADPDRDTHLVDLVQNRINEIYAGILERPAFAELLRAQEESGKLMEAVNNTISYMITGKLPECSHDCASCGGACHQ